MIKKILAVLLVGICFLQYIGIVFALDKTEAQARAIVAYERNTKTFLCGKNESVKMPMASTTKIMTAILLIESGKINEVATVSKRAQNVTGWQLELTEGEKISLQDLLYALMLYSANDGAIVVAEHIAGSVEAFSTMMNNKVKEIGANSTNFTSPHGLDDDKHYSTARDMALIMDYALNIPMFRKAISTQEYTLKISNRNMSIKNTNRLLGKQNGCVGGKTGYTGKAFYCLANNVKKDDFDLVIVALGAETSNIRFNEVEKLTNHVLENYIYIDLNDYVKDSIIVNCEKGEKKYIVGKCEKIPKIVAFRENVNDIKCKYYILDTVIMPIKSNEKVGIASIYLKNEKIASLGYYTSEVYRRKTYIEYFR